MDLFSPSGLPGVGFGDLGSIAAIGGMLAVAVTSGALIAEGFVGVLVFLAAAGVVLSTKHEFLGGRPEIVIAVLAVLLVAAVLRVLLARRADLADVSAAEDHPGRVVRALDAIAVGLGTAAVGYAWSEWDHRVFGFDEAAGAGLAAGLVAGAVGAAATMLFARGAVRAGGHAGIVGATVAIVALALNALGFYVPFAGYVVFLLAIFMAVRLRRRTGRKYKGLRILAG